jgi:hypothetical protein
LTNSVDGVLMKANSEEDLDIFNNFIIYKKTKKKLVVCKMLYPDIKRKSTIHLINLGEHEILCNCHNKLINTYYLCECYSVYCKIPYFCKFCSTLIINDLYLSQIKDFLNYIDCGRHTSKLIPLHSLSDPHNFNIILKRELVQSEYEKFIQYYLDQIRRAKQHSSTSLDEQMSVIAELSYVNKLKLNLLFCKYEQEKKPYGNIDKIITHLKLDDFIAKSTNFYLKDMILCSGCDFAIEKLQNKEEELFKDFYTCLSCLEIFCK